MELQSLGRLQCVEIHFLAYRLIGISRSRIHPSRTIVNSLDRVSRAQCLGELPNVYPFQRLESRVAFVVPIFKTTVIEIEPVDIHIANHEISKKNDGPPAGDPSPYRHSSRGD